MPNPMTFAGLSTVAKAMDREVQDAALMKMVRKKTPRMMIFWRAATKKKRRLVKRTFDDMQGIVAGIGEDSLVVSHLIEGNLDFQDRPCMKLYTCVDRRGEPCSSVETFCL